MTIAVLGEALWDLYPERPGEALADRPVHVRHVGGAAANVACTLARLGVSVKLLACVGDDALGRGLREAIAATGVDVAGVRAVPTRTGLCFVDVDGAGHARFLGYRSSAAEHAIAASDVPAPLGVQWLACGTLALGREPSASALRVAVERARSEGAHVAVDVNLQRHLWPEGVDVVSVVRSLCVEADIVQVSATDLPALGGEAFLAAIPARQCFVTLGDGGARARTPSGWIERNAAQVAVVDATGAGDAFFSGVLALAVAHPEAFGPSRAFDEAFATRALSVGSALGARCASALGAQSAFAIFDAHASAERLAILDAISASLHPAP